MKKRTSEEIFAETLLELSRHTALDKITVKKIVEESGLSLQTFYNHFKDKYELILWIHKSEGDRTMARMGSRGYGYDDMIMDNIRFFLDHKEFMKNALENTHGKDSYAEMAINNAYRVWTQYIISKHGRAFLTKEIVFYLRMYCSSWIRMMAEWAFTMDDITPEEFAQYMRSCIPEKLRKYLTDTD